VANVNACWRSPVSVPSPPRPSLPLSLACNLCAINTRVARVCVLADAHRGDAFGATPFHIACSRGNWPVVHDLLQLLGDQKGEPESQVNQRDQNGETALHWAARSGRRDVVELLLAQPAIDAAAEGNNGTAAQVR